MNPVGICDKLEQKHRNEEAYPVLWRAVTGAVKAAKDAHPEIEIPKRWMASLVKRVVGQVLAEEVRSTLVDEKPVRKIGFVQADDVVNSSLGRWSPGIPSPTLKERLRSWAKSGLHSGLYKKVLSDVDLAADRIDELEEALLWYAETSEQCHAPHSAGDMANMAIYMDAGKRARSALAGSKNDEVKDA